MCGAVFLEARAQGLGVTTGIVELKVVKETDDMKAQLKTLPARQTEILQGPPGTMEIGDSRPFSPIGGSPKSQRGGERGNLGEFGHLGLPGGAGHGPF
jgi:hypothetical protein